MNFYKTFIFLFTIFCIVKAQNDISNSILNIGKSILNEDLKNQNVDMEAISPLCIVGALSLLQLGSVGTVYSDLRNFMNQDTAAAPSVYHQNFGYLIDSIINPAEKISPEIYNISVANAVFLANGFKIRGDYKNAAEQIYHGKVENVNFGTEETETYINNWVDAATNGKIKEIAGGLTHTNLFVMISALYFKGFWAETNIEVESTTKRDFYPNGRIGNAVSTDTIRMNIDNVPYYNSPEFDCQIVGLPYEGHKSIMYVILPNRSSRLRMKDFLKEITANQIDELISKTELRGGDVFIPKFHTETTVDLKNVLSKLGLASMFNPQISEYSLISGNQTTDLNEFRSGQQSLQNLDILAASQLDNPNFYVGEAIHKVVITVDEKGTEGGAATFLTLDRLGSIVKNRIEVFVDSPFLYVIKEQSTKFTIFMGTVFEPKFK